MNTIINRRFLVLSIVNKVLRILFILLSIQFVAIPVFAQKKKQKDQVTPQNAMDKQNKNQEQKQAQYQERKKTHVKKQDKATQKRMKKNLKRAQKHSWGKEVPWYKRWFRKSKV